MTDLAPEAITLGCDPWDVPPGCRWPPDKPASWTDQVSWDALVADVWESATDVVWALTGRRFGVCTIAEEFRLTTQDSCLPVPLLWRGQWFNSLATPGWPCCEVRLDPGPVIEVLEVRVDGVVLDPAEWVLDGNRLSTADGSCWPFTLPCEQARMVVAYTFGTAPETLLLLAAAAVATEVIAPCTGGVCTLPGNVVAVTRQGVTVQLGDPAFLLQAGLTGVPLLDLAIRTYNPNRLAVRSRVFSVDVPRPQVLWPQP